VKNPSLFLTLPLLLVPPVIVLKFVYWDHAQQVVSLDMVVRMFAGGFLPGGTRSLAGFRAAIIDLHQFRLNVVRQRWPPWSWNSF
jgi:RsiW-degrading membrane proteinase PrsW (M82 family)